MDMAGDAKMRPKLWVGPASMGSMIAEKTVSLDVHSWFSAVLKMLYLTGPEYDPSLRMHLSWNSQVRLLF